MNKRHIILGIVLVAIIGVIFFLQKGAPSIPSGMNVNQISVAKFDIINASERVKEKSDKYSLANELVAPSGYINTNDENIALSSLVGKKVILVDFWTYSCINCQRTLPYLNTWYEKYKSKGLEIISVHTPEFDFEKKYENVLSAVKKYNVLYPVVLDNNYYTWRAYNNRYWPRKYLIDIDGFIVYDHIGEGGYTETEQKIQELLEERKMVLETNDSISQDVFEGEAKPDFKAIETPEIYFGYSFSRDQLGNEEGFVKNAVVHYNQVLNREENKFYLVGDWLNDKDNMKSLSDSNEVYLNYTAKVVNIVAGSSSGGEISVYLDNAFLKTIEITNYDLYELVAMNEYSNHEIRLVVSEGVELFTFTFG